MSVLIGPPPSRVRRVAAPESTPSSISLAIRKSSNLHLAVGRDEDVRRLEVAVHDQIRVGVGDRDEDIEK
jgi:hypothetical protein